MERKINFLDVVAVKKDYVFKQASGTMHCKKGSQGRVVDVGNSSKGTYYCVEFFDKSEIDDPVFCFSKDELELVQTKDEERAEYLKNHPQYINDKKWLEDHQYDLKKIKEIWAKEKNDGKGN